MGMQFRPVTEEELKMLRPALEQNARKNVPLTMRTKDTGFLATPEADEEVENLINQIKSIPCHYASWNSMDPPEIDAPPEQKRTDHLTHFLIVGPFVWGKGESQEAAWKQVFKVRNSRKKPTKYIVFKVDPDAYVNDMGDLCYKIKGDEFEPYLEIERVGCK